MDSLIPFTTSGSLVDCVDRKMLVVLRDGRKLHGVLRSYDQFANLVLEDTVERIYAGDTFAEKWCGLFLIRGENVVLLGEIDLDQEDDVPLRQVDYKELDDYYRQDVAAKKQREEAKAKILYEQKGFLQGRRGGRWLLRCNSHEVPRFPADSLSPRGSEDNVQS
ncbi:Sm-like ribonucleoprotein [Lactarius hengduanensis]|nr:Sm-like ribonucleoprotein [Lactarius hengduanensis]